MDTRDQIIDRIKEHLPLGLEADHDVREDSVFSELGVGSLHLIAMLFALREEYGLDTQQMVESGMPTTVRELVTLIEKRVPP